MFLSFLPNQCASSSSCCCDNQSAVNLLSTTRRQSTFQSLNRSIHSMVWSCDDPLLAVMRLLSFFDCCLPFHQCNLPLLSFASSLSSFDSDSSLVAPSSGSCVRFALVVVFLHCDLMTQKKASRFAKAASVVQNVRSVSFATTSHESSLTNAATRRFCRSDFVSPNSQLDSTLLALLLLVVSQTSLLAAHF